MNYGPGRVPFGGSGRYAEHQALARVRLCYF